MIRTDEILGAIDAYLSWAEAPPYPASVMHDAGNLIITLHQELESAREERAMAVRALEAERQAEAVVRAWNQGESR